jgi:uncharacterized membrane protein
MKIVEQPGVAKETETLDEDHNVMLNDGIFAIAITLLALNINLLQPINSLCVPNHYHFSCLSGFRLLL